MPETVYTQTPGAANADFQSAPGLHASISGQLATPGRAERPQTERLDQLRSLIVAGGQAVAGGVAAEARLQLLAKQRADERKAEAARLAAWVKSRRAEEDGEREAAYRSASKERLKEIERSQFEILRDPRSENNEWVLNEAVMRQGNANYPEERDAWMDFILRYQGAARQDTAKEAALTAKVANAGLISDRRIAAKSANNAIDDLWNDVQMDADLKQTLIGDGRGINDRVNTHVLKVAMQAAPQLFQIDKADPYYAEKMTQQTILLDELEARAQARIVQPLTNQFVADTQKAMEETGADRIDVASQAFAEGNMTASEYHDIMGDTLRVQFAHVDPKQRDKIRERLYSQQFDRLANLLDQPDPGKALERMESLISVADLTPTERQIVREQVIGDKFPKAVEKRLKEMFAQKLAMTAGITRLNDGRTIVPKDAKTVQVEMLENGSYRDIAGQLLDSLHLTGDPANFSPLQANLLAVVTQATLAEEAKAHEVQLKASKSTDLAVRFLSGSTLTTAEANDQWNDGALMRMFNGKLSADDPVFQAIATSYKATSGKDFPWDGQGPIPVTAETLPILRDVAIQEGAAWGRNGGAPIPASMANALENMVLYETPEKAEVALNFWQGLGSAGQERLGQSLSARSQMVLMEGQRLYGLDPVHRASSMAEIANRMRTIDQNSAVAALRLAKSQAGLHDVTPDARFTYDYAKALSTALGKDVLKDEYGLESSGFKLDLPGGGLGDPLGQEAVQGLGQAFGSEKALVPLFAQMAVVMQANPGIKLDQAAVVVSARMREQGYKVVTGTLGKQIVKDSWGHYPSDVTPGVLIQQNLTVPMSKAEADRFVSRIPGAGPQTRAMTRDGIVPADILWSHLSEQAGSALPHPREWAFTPETNGQMFTGLMAQQDGGVPMHVTIPGLGRTQMLLDVDGNPLLVASSKRRANIPRPVDKSGIPDYFLTKGARHRVKLAPDSAEKMRQMLDLADEAERQSRGQF